MAASEAPSTVLTALTGVCRGFWCTAQVTFLPSPSTKVLSLLTGTSLPSSSVQAQGPFCEYPAGPLPAERT